MTEVNNNSVSQCPTIPSINYSDDEEVLAETVRLYREFGFVVINGVFTEEDTQEMQQEIDRIVKAMDPNQHPTATFNGTDANKHISNKYFLESVDKIRYFYEEDAIDPKTGEFLIARNKALNKVGHALHWLNPVFRKFTFHNRIKKIVRLVGQRKPKVMQSMYIFKQPKIGGIVDDHVDSTFLRTVPSESLLGIWIAVDSARLENGCLWFIPKSHHDYIEESKNFRFVRNDSEDGPLVRFNGIKPKYDSQKFVPVEVERGSLVLLDGKVVHKSGKNTSDRSRHAYTFHLVDTEGTNWDELNWIQETDQYKFPLLYDNSIN